MKASSLDARFVQKLGAIVRAQQGTRERDAALPRGSELPRDVLPGGTQPGGVPGPSAEAWPGRSHQAGQNGRRIWGGSRAEAFPIGARAGRLLSSVFSWFTGTNHSCLALFFRPLLPGGLCDEVNLSCAYLELMLVEGKMPITYI